eukprot:TRINITY_DN13552_c0_g1_i1.p1 TRINITY_DN13552_c0_g1~~TRINITY_DN13552_c0_g1_i1.p1  ORF type:complete len:347 (+),score=58.68 TRINITY_DN13552_c0_g1_i1:68-1108(+)
MQQAAVVCDVGSIMKVGLTGDSRPRCVYTAEPARSEIATSADDEPGCHKDDLERRMSRVFNKDLRTASEDRNVLLAQAVWSKVEAAAAAEVVFEEFGVHGLHIASTALMSLYASGRTTGMIFESGHRTTRAVPIYEGYPVPNSTVHSASGGRDLSAHLKSVLAQKHEGTFDDAGVRSVKENHAYVALDYREAVAKGSELDSEYELPDGSVVALGTELFRAPEALFDPPSAYGTSTGMHTLLMSSVGRCDNDWISDVYANFVLCGGTTKLQGFRARLEREVRALAPPSARVDVVPAHSDPDSPLAAGTCLAAWCGGSILSAFPWEPMWMTRSRYDEEGGSALSTDMT